MTNHDVVAITIGDPAGVGPEITLKSFESGAIRERGVPLVIGDAAVLEAVRKRLGIPVEIETVRSSDEARRIRGKVPVIDIGVVTNPADLAIGKIGALGGKAAVAAIRKAVDLVGSGEAAGIATAPINKEAVRAAGFHYIGHTEMIEEMSGSAKGITMFQVDKLKIFFHSRHLSLRRAIDAVTEDSLLESIRVADRCLRSIGYGKTRLAVAAMNPHASDGGLFGDEEAVRIAPAVARARAAGIDVVGPVPADSVFHLGIEGRYDAVLSLYHDQGHIAAKCYDFYRVVSVTFGYPFIRTSVDHGTAFDIAWKGVANPRSMEEAILACLDIAGTYRPMSGAGA